MWRVIRDLGDIRVLLNFSYFTIRRAHSSEITFEHWIKSYILYAKALTLNNRCEEALEVLRNVLDIFANIPLEEIKFISEIHKTNKISSTNNFVNFDYALTFYSKYHVYAKNRSIFHLNYRLKNGKDKFTIPGNISRSLLEQQASARKQLRQSLFNQSYTASNIEDDKYRFDSLIANSIENDQIEADDYVFVKRKSVPDVNKHRKDAPKEDRTIEDIHINSIDKLEEYVENNIESIEIPQEYTCK